MIVPLHDFDNAARNRVYLSLVPGNSSSDPPPPSPQTVALYDGFLANSAQVVVVVEKCKRTLV